MAGFARFDASHAAADMPVVCIERCTFLGRQHPCRGAEADLFSWPRCSAGLGDSPVALGRGGRWPVVQVLRGPQVLGGMMAGVIPQLHPVEKFAAFPDVQSSESLGTGVDENCGGTAVPVHRRRCSSLPW